MNSNTNTKILATVQIIARLAADGVFEIIVDVRGGFVFRDKLKANGFQFVKDSSQGLGSETSLDQHGERKRKPVWRRMIVAVPNDASPERIVKGLQIAFGNLDQLLETVLEGSRVKGGKSASLTLAQHYADTPEIQPLVQHLASLDTPWIENDAEVTIRRPEFAA